MNPPPNYKLKLAIRRLETLELAISEVYEMARANSEPMVEEAKELRAFILAQAFGSQPKEGTEHRELFSFKLTCEQKFNRTVDDPVLSQLTPYFRQQQIPTLELIRLKRELDLRAYRRLNPHQRKCFDRALIIKPATPTLTLLRYAGQKD